MQKIASASLHICGAGALGSNLAVHLSRMGFKQITIIDRDRVEERNLGTQIYALDDVGAQKATLVRNVIYREVGEDTVAISEELNDRTVAKFLKNARLVVDTFDNTASRQLIYDYCKQKNIACLHAGVNEGFGEIRWNEHYSVPSDTGIDVCDYPLSRSLVLLVVTIAAEALVQFVVDGQKPNYSVTVGDLRINHEVDLS